MVKYKKFTFFNRSKAMKTDADNYVNPNIADNAAQTADPVCGMKVEPSKATKMIEYEGRKIFFCSENCQNKFKNNPDKYTKEVSDTSEQKKNKSRGEAEGKKKNIYTCPMHPEVVKEGPGTCPKCGMALEPKSATDQEENNDELTLIAGG